jgi:hypothetical protein
MRRLLGWIGGAVGGIAAYRWLRREPLPEPDVTPEPDARAEELRARLAETRATEPVPEQVVEEPAAAEPESPEERRQRVHQEGRAALDEMKPE